MTEPILFYTTGEKYGAFSNFSRHGFTLGGKYWKTSEHYFQAQKAERRKGKFGFLCVLCSFAPLRCSFIFTLF